MANYANLKSAIQQVIKTNGNNEITGSLLQQSLLAMINSLGEGYQYMGIATPTTNPGTPDQNVFYLASVAGTYSNFGSIVIAENEAAILKYNGTWSKDSSGFATSEKVSQLDAKFGDDVTYLETVITPVWVNGSVKKTDGSIAETTTYKYTTVQLGNAKFVRFLGNAYNSPDSWGGGYAFYDENDVCIFSFGFNASDTGANHTKEYRIPVPEGAVSFKTTVYDGPNAYTVVRPTDFYCYLITGDSISDLIDNIEIRQNGKTEQYSRNIELDEFSHFNDSFQLKVPASGTPLSSVTKANSTTCRNAIVPLSGASRIEFYCYASSSGYGSMFIDGNKNVISGISRTSSEESIIVLDVPSTAEYFIYSYFTGSDASNHIKIFYASTEKITTDKIENGAVTHEKIAPGAIGLGISGSPTKYVSFNVYDSSKAQMGYINKNTGAFVPLSSGNYRATDFIPVSQTVRAYNYVTYGSVGGHAVYDANKNYLRSTGEVYTYVEGDGYVRFTINNTATYKFILYENLNITGAFAPTYQEQTITPFSGSQVFAKENVPSLIPAYSSVGQDGAGIAADTLDASLVDSGGNLIKIQNLRYLKSCRIVSFTAKITTAGTFDVGFGRGSSLGYFVRVDGTNIDIRKYTGSGTASMSISQHAHGLTIASFITIVFTVKYKQFVVNVVSSDGQYNYTLDENETREQYGFGFAEVTDGAVVTKAVLRLVSDRMRKPVWVVGDSYTSLYNQRWTKQLIDTYNVDNFLIIGLAGGTSDDMYPQLQDALLFGTPKFLVWCLGMNDEYWKWKDIVIKVEMLCRALGIELILQTIPWPTNGSKESINNYVRSSGYRYVDVYAAVSSDDSGTWYDGMNDDGTHPTTFGAKAIAGRFLVDFPEIAQ